MNSSNNVPTYSFINNAENQSTHVTPASSTNHKEDIIKARLHELKIAYQIIAQCEHCKNKFTNAVKMGANPPEQQKNQIERQGQHY